MGGIFGENVTRRTIKKAKETPCYKVNKQINNSGNWKKLLELTVTGFLETQENREKRKLNITNGNKLKIKELVKDSQSQRSQI